jgi:hypothetical protein
MKKLSVTCYIIRTVKTYMFIFFLFIIFYIPWIIWGKPHSDIGIVNISRNTLYNGAWGGVVVKALRY